MSLPPRPTQTQSHTKNAQQDEPSKNHSFAVVLPCRSDENPTSLEPPLAARAAVKLVFEDSSPTSAHEAPGVSHRTKTRRCQQLSGHAARGFGKHWHQPSAAQQSNPLQQAHQGRAVQSNSTSTSNSATDGNATLPGNSAPSPIGGSSAGSKQKSGQTERTGPTEPQQSKRLMWVVPNFGAVSADTELPPLSARAKFVLAYHDSFDYSGFVWTGIVAAQSYGLNSDPELGQGAAAYGRYYWRAFVDGVSGTYFTEAIVPAITREDPRYFTLGHGGFARRIGYALSRTLLTKTDSGGTSFDWSEVGGNLLEAGLSNAYYPPQERGVSQTFNNWGVQMESAALNNVAKEFWPDIRSRILRRK